MHTNLFWKPFKGWESSKTFMVHISLLQSLLVTQFRNIIIIQDSAIWSWVSDPSESHNLCANLAQPLNSFLATATQVVTAYPFPSLPSIRMVTVNPCPRLSRARGRSHACTSFSRTANGLQSTQSDLKLTIFSPFQLMISFHFTGDQFNMISSFKVSHFPQ